jgi:hypothetical protein
LHEYRAPQRVVLFRFQKTKGDFRLYVEGQPKGSQRAIRANASFPRNIERMRAIEACADKRQGTM